MPFVYFFFTGGGGGGGGGIFVFGAETIGGILFTLGGNFNSGFIIGGELTIGLFVGLINEFKITSLGGKGGFPIISWLGLWDCLGSVNGGIGSLLGKGGIAGLVGKGGISGLVGKGGTIDFWFSTEPLGEYTLANILFKQCNISSWLNWSFSKFTFE